VVLSVMALPALAQQQQPNLPADARFVGYPERLWVEPPGMAGAWFLLAGLGLVALGPLFLNAHRTHLD
jgi:hypothetical protein